MCGIAGFVKLQASSDLFPNIVLSMLGRIKYRGPDETGYYFDEEVALGAVRLSIIDLETGQQPISDPTGRYHLVYNGEIYNYLEIRAELQSKGYRFLTTSDTEVLLHAWMAWGRDCLPKLNGGFAFAIYDRESKELFLARDRVGKRPLYYATMGSAFIFGSELKCFLDVPGMAFSWDMQQLATIFTTWTPLPHETGFAQAHQVPPGSYLTYRDGAVKCHHYAQIELGGAPAYNSELGATESLKDLLHESVRLRMRSDVEVGTYLSGGLDSAIVTKLVSEQTSQPLHTFSVEFEDSDFDESQQQRIVSQALSTRHHSVKVSQLDIAENFPHAVWHSEVPLFRTAVVPMYLLSKTVNDTGIKVILTGEGSDEAFLGYDIFKETYAREHWFTFDEQARHTFVSQLYPYLKHFDEGNVAALVGIYNQFSKDIDSPTFSHDLRFSNSKFVLRLLNTSLDGTKPLKQYIEADPVYAKLNRMERAQWLEFKTLLAGYLLSSQGDRMSLANSVENRCPFLDHNLLRFASTLPIEMRLRNGKEEKYILKKAFGDQLPPEIVNRPKQPFRAPDAACFLGDGPPAYVEALLSESELRKSNLFDVSFTARLSAKLLKTDPGNISPRENQALVLLLSVLMLDQWFVRRQAPASEVCSNVVKAVDGRYGHSNTNAEVCAPYR